MKLEKILIRLISNNKKVLSFISFKITFLFSILIYIIFKNNQNFKVCLCTLGKNENKYALEYVRHYRKYGVDKIFIYDNNDINGEKFEHILSKYINNNFVEILDYRGRYRIQLEILNHCYRNNYKNYNWLILFDMDEFIYLNGYKDIKKYLKKKIFDDCKVIFLNEVKHTDSNHIYYKKGMLSKRFKNILVNASIIMVKPILKGNIENLVITNNHVINLNMEGCNGYGNKITIEGIHTNNPDNKNFYFDHYFFKSSEEYLNKLARGSCYWGNLRKINFDWLNKYLMNNEISIEKINFFEKKTSINLSAFRNKIKII